MRIFLTLLLLVTFVTTAEAHSPLLSSSPAHTALIDDPIDQISLVFEDPVRLTKVEVIDGNADLYKPTFERSSNKEFQITTEPTLGPGTYKVTWRALAEDGHTMAGRFVFVIRSPAE